MFFFGRIVAPFHSPSCKTRNSKMLTNSEFEMELSFAIIGNIASTALKFINNARTKENRNFIYEWEEIDQLALTLEHNSRIAMGEFFFITPLILVRIWSENISKYRSTIIKSFLGTVLRITFCVNIMSKKFLIHLSTKSGG